MVRVDVPRDWFHRGINVGRYLAGLSMKTVGHVMMCRDKARHVEKAVRSVFAQTYSPFTMYFSCQESRDDTVEIVQRLANEYDGPNKLVVLHCPHNEYRGYAGMIAHWKWLQDQVEEDIIVDCSADDYNHPDRVKRIFEVFNTYNPSYVGTKVQYLTDTGVPWAETAFNDQRSRVIHKAEAIRNQIGSSGSMAFARDLWHDHKKDWKPLDAVDVILPILALFERGLYFIDEILHYHVNHSDPENTGMEGQLAAVLNDPVAYNRVAECNNFHNVHHWTRVLQQIMDNGWWQRFVDSPDAYAALRDKIFDTACLWSDAREKLTMERIQPMSMAV